MIAMYCRPMSDSSEDNESTGSNDNGGGGFTLTEGNSVTINGGLARDNVEAASTARHIQDDGKQEPEMHEIAVDDEEHDYKQHHDEDPTGSGTAESGGGGVDGEGRPVGNIVLNRNRDLTERVHSLRNWGVTKFIKTKQRVKQRLGRSQSRTVDLALGDRLDRVRAQRANYEQLVANNRRTIEQLGQLRLVLRCSGVLHADLAQTERALSVLFLEHSHQHTASAALLDQLIGKISGLTGTLETLVGKTFDDLLGTVRAYEEARVEYDAFSAEVDRLAVTNSNQSGGDKRNGEGPEQARLREMQENLERSRAKFETSKTNVVVKLDLLEEHKNRVIERELANCRHAWLQYHAQCNDVLSQSQEGRSRFASKSEEDQKNERADH